jgi:WD40 repeat protein
MSRPSERAAPERGARPPPSGSRIECFLSYNREDASALEELARQLHAAGHEPWLDRWFLVPGRPWQPAVAEALYQCSACAVFVGPHGLGEWAREELAVAQERTVGDPSFRLFLVLLPGALDPFDPSLAFVRSRTWVDLRDDLHSPAALGKLIAAITGRAVLDGADAPAAGAVCPYRGLAAFEEADAPYFFGREAETARVVEKLRRSRFLAVLGPSGSGKSSLVRAGAIPALRRGALPGSADWLIRVFKPGARPSTALATQLATLGGGEAMHRTLERLGEDERTVDLAVGLAVTELGARRGVIVVDQFEEVFTLCDDERDREAFLANLTYAATIPSGATMVVLALRADFYERCAAHRALRSLVAAEQFLVGPLDRERLRETVERPAAAAGLRLEAGLVERVVADAEGAASALPLLEHALLETFKAREGRLLTLTGYEESGGVREALAQRADGIYLSLSEPERAVAQQVLLRLIQPGDGAQDTRRRCPFSELATDAEQAEIAERLVRRFADDALVSTGRDPLSGKRIVEVTHEALITGWPRLQGWLAEKRDFLRARRQLTDAAAEWHGAGGDEDMLYRGARLAAWSERGRSDLNELECAFLRASEERAARERARARRRLQTGVAALAAVVVIVSVAAAIALREAHRSANARDAATRSAAAQLSLRATDEIERDPQDAAFLARRAEATGLAPDAAATLRTALAQAMPVTTLGVHDGRVRDVDVSPDQRLALSAGDDGVVHIWQVDHPRARPVTLAGHGDGVRTAAFAADGRHVLTLDGLGTVRYWDRTRPSKPLGRFGSGIQIARLAPRGDAMLYADDRGRVGLWHWDTRGAATRLWSGAPPTVLRFSPDGRFLLSADSSGFVRVWDTHRKLYESSWHAAADRVLGASFAPDGRHVAAATDAGGLRVWNAADPSAPAEPLGGVSAVAGNALFSADGRRIVAPGLDGNVRVYRLGADGRGAVVLRGAPQSLVQITTRACACAAVARADGSVQLWAGDLGDRTPITLRGHDGPANAVEIGDHGRFVVTGGEDGAVRLWRPEPTNPAKLLRGHDGALNGVAFSHDGRHVASASDDGTARVWPVAAPGAAVVLRGDRATAVNSVAFSPDDRYVATAGDDKKLRVWDPARPERAVAVLAQPDVAWSPAFTPDGRDIAVGGLDGVVRVADWRRPEAEPVALSGHQGGVTGVAFSPDGDRVVSASDDGTARVWDWRHPTRHPVVLRGHTAEVNSAGFSADGRYVVTGSADGTVRVWSWRAAKPTAAVLRGHAGWVWGATFLPGGRLVASAGDDGTVRVWEWRKPALPPMVMDGGKGWVTGVAPSPDGTRLAAAGPGRAVRVWQCATCGSAAELLRLARTRAVQRPSAANERSNDAQATSG